MSYAVRNDGLGWRAVRSRDDVGPDEHFSEQEPPPADIRADSIREMRVPLLLVADHRINFLEDNGLDSTAWRRYRQSLRDVTLQQTFPDSVTWPDLPVD